MEEEKVIGRAVVKVDCDTTEAMRKLDELAEKAGKVSEALAAAGGAGPGEGFARAVKARMS